MGRSRGNLDHVLCCRNLMHTDPLHSLVVYVGIRRTPKIPWGNFDTYEPATTARSCLLIRSPCWPHPGLSKLAENKNRAFCISASVNGPSLSASAGGDSPGYDTRVTTHFFISQQSLQQVISGRLFLEAKRSRLPYVKEMAVS